MHLSLRSKDLQRVLISEKDFSELLQVVSMQLKGSTFPCNPGRRWRLLVKVVAGSQLLAEALLG